MEGEYWLEKGPGEIGRSGLRSGTFCPLLPGSGRDHFDGELCLFLHAYLTTTSGNTTINTSCRNRLTECDATSPWIPGAAKGRWMAEVDVEQRWIRICLTAAAILGKEFTCSWRKEEEEGTGIFSCESEAARYLHQIRRSRSWTELPPGRCAGRRGPGAFGRSHCVLKKGRTGPYGRPLPLY